ncbi:hypothetical protein GSI_06811 [Ganoderma sinense ZZ0214-1]|uniref:Uncharacterized protein n=1 Tax=Ganoderma sinense ZZ0214-1 TaxID=1077348 RepID=A0A2G8SEB0_9APHY|nr:hypothetical protein GSI_06811 [Ganoderma sinense ZZ0214-1]
MSSCTDRHRPRSYSVFPESSPTPRRQTDEVKGRLSVKRSRPSSIRGPSYKDLAHDQPAEKWDVDLWRKGKRQRDSNAGESSDEGGSSSRLTAIGAAFPTRNAPASPSSASGLPCTSAAFQFFPQKQKLRRRASGPRPGRSLRGISPREGDRISSDEARRMRASALGELRRSVEENGEGLVRRIRDWEQSRSTTPRSPVAPTALETPRREWRRPTFCFGVPEAQTAVAEESEDEDDDDLFIVGGTSSGIARTPAHKKRAVSLSMMNDNIPVASSPFADLGDGDRTASLIDCSSGPSAYSSDDEGHADMDTDLSSSGIFSTPALSLTYSVSTNSSLVSLALPTQDEGVMSPTFPSSTAVVRGNARSTPPPPTASRSEKAIAALTLAIASGAAGLSDYEALRMAEELITLDESHAGELWD